MADRKKIAFLVAAEGTERVELTEPWQAVSDAGYQPVLLSPETGEVQTFKHLTAAEKAPVDQAVGEASVDDFAALVLPGGVANPDALRTNETAVEFVKSFVDSGKPVAAICHAPWTLVEADGVRGKTVTSWPSLQTDLRNAGANWVDETVVTDGNLITSRKPDDLPAFSKTLLDAVGCARTATPRCRPKAVAIAAHGCVIERSEYSRSSRSHGRAAWRASANVRASPNAPVPRSPSPSGGRWARRSGGCCRPPTTR